MDKKKSKNIIFFTTIIFIIIFTVFLYNENTSSYIKYNTLTTDYKMIIDRNSDILVNTIKTYSLYIIPNRINNLEYVMNILTNNLQLNKIEIQNRIFNSNSITLIKDDLNQHEVEDLKKLNLNCLLLLEKVKRIYQYKNFAIDIIGYDSNNKLLDGIEYYYMNEYNKKENHLIEDSLRLTIDKNIQMTLENYLKELSLKPNSNLSIILMSSDTGEIISLSNLPHTKLNKDNTVLIKYPNYAITDLYKPTPIIFLVNELIENKNQSNYELNIIESLNSAKIDHIKIRPDILNTTLENEQIRNKIINLLIHLGFGQKTGIDLPFENTGYFQYDLLANNVQFLYATPIQILVAYNSIIKNGKVIKPVLNTNSFNQDNIKNLTLNDIDWAKKDEILKKLSHKKFLYISEEKINHDESELILLGHYPIENPKISFIFAAKKLDLDYLLSNHIHYKILDLVQIASKIKFLNSNIVSTTNQEIKKDVNNEIMPNLIGLPLRTAINILSGSCKIQIEGEGLIVSQLPKPGSKLENTTTCKLKLSHTL